MANKFNSPKPYSKLPQTKPGAKTGKRAQNKKMLGIAMPHKGSARGRKPTLGEQYPRQ